MIIIAGIAALMVYVVTLYSLKEFGIFGGAATRFVLAACVAGLTFLSFTEQGKFQVILLPYQALGLTLLLTFLILLFSKAKSGDRSQRIGRGVEKGLRTLAEGGHWLKDTIKRKVF